MKRLLPLLVLAVAGCMAHGQASDVATSDAQASSARVDGHCLRDTGSIVTARRNAHVAKGDQRCTDVGGRSYSRDDLGRTGETDPADALRKLDPAIR